MTTVLTDDETPQTPARLQSSVALPEFRVVQADRADPLSKCVEDALETYLQNMDGHAVTDLYQLVIEEVERPLFETAVRHTQGNLSQAAKLLGLTRSTLRKRLKDYGIERGR